MNSLERAVDKKFPGFEVLDVDIGAADCVDRAGGRHRVKWTIDDAGEFEIGARVRVPTAPRPAAGKPAAQPRHHHHHHLQVMVPPAGGDDFASLPAWDWPVELPRARHQPAPIAHGRHVGVHELAAMGGAPDDFAPLGPGNWDAPHQKPSEAPDYMPLPKSDWS